MNEQLEKLIKPKMIYIEHKGLRFRIQIYVAGPQFIGYSIEHWECVKKNPDLHNWLLKLDVNQLYDEIHRLVEQHPEVKILKKELTTYFKSASQSAQTHIIDKIWLYIKELKPLTFTEPRHIFVCV